MTAPHRASVSIAPWLLAVGLATSPVALASTTHTHDHEAGTAGEDIGVVDFRVSCDEAVRADFNRALGLMHHMMYVQARSAFEAVTEADPDCAMAYWGIATTLFQPLWGTRPSEPDLERGRALIAKARALEPATGREVALVEATAGFFDDPQARFWARIDGWVDGMAAAYRAHPDDLDIAALYALSRLTRAQVAEDRHSLHDEAETVLRAVWEREPRHPGAIHYSIHATDAEGRAENALDLVEAYARIAPEVPHALHMPSHIYVRLGEWPEVIEWNRRSAEAALGHPVNGAVSHHYVHAVDYLVYAHLQRGEDHEARAVLEEALGKHPHQASFVSAFHHAAMPARQAVERRDWAQAAALEPRSPDYLPWDASPWAEGLSWLARGLGGLHTGDREGAREAEQRLAALRDEAKAEGDDRIATYIEVDRRILAGWMARAEGEDDRAVELVRSAGQLEGTVEKHPVTPGALLPPYEALGDLLLDLGRPVEALEAYQTSDRIWPGRFNTLLGAARAAYETGDEAVAGGHYRALLDIAGDSSREALREARSFVDGG
jgi:tetratricopeptide (TPR) repeat protein